VTVAVEVAGGWVEVAVGVMVTVAATVGTGVASCVSVGVAVAAGGSAFTSIAPAETVKLRTKSTTKCLFNKLLLPCIAPYIPRQGLRLRRACRKYTTRVGKQSI